MAISVSYRNTTRSFQFIVSDTPGPVNDPVLRKTIRKQAMVDAGRARRLRGNYGRLNLGQTMNFEGRADDTTFLSPSSGSASDSKSPWTPQDDASTETFLSHNQDTETQVLQCDLQKSYLSQPIIHQIPAAVTGYERVRAKFQIDLPQLSMLTSFNMASSIVNGGAADPKRLASLMKYQQSSFLEFVPSMYDSSSFVAAATDSLLAKVSSILVPTRPNLSLELALYVRALKLLQSAIEEHNSEFDAEILCAIQLLSLRDLLNPSRNDAWATHVRGCARLFQRRTPRRIESDFEKALFVSHVGPVLSEAFKANSPCYLERPEWTGFYQSLMNDTGFLHRQSRIAVKARVSIFCFPRLWRDVDHAMRGKDIYDNNKLRLLEKRCQALHRDLLDWKEEHRVYCRLTSDSIPSGPELCLQRELFGAVMDCLALVKRLLATVSETYSSKLEAEVQGIAQWMLNMQRFPSPKWSWLFGGHETLVAQAAILTRDAYAKDMSGETLEKRRLHMRGCYLTWYHLLQLDFHVSQS